MTELFDTWPPASNRVGSPPLLIECAHSENVAISISRSDAYYIWKAISGLLGEDDSRPQGFKASMAYTQKARIVGLEIIYDDTSDREGTRVFHGKLICAMQHR